VTKVKNLERKKPTASFATRTSPRGRKLRSRYRRTKPTPPIELTARDVAFLLDCVFLRAVLGNATFLLAASHSTGLRPPRSYWKQRENQLYQAEWLSRFYPPKSFYVTGAGWPVCIMEPGYVSYAIDEGFRVDVLLGEDRKKYLAASAGMREKLLQLMTANGIDADVAASMLENNGALAEKFCSGRTSNIPHTLLASTFLALAWYGLRKAGYAIGHRQPDGFIDWKFRVEGEAEVRRIQPDGFFTINRAEGLEGFALEAETGETGYKALVKKIRAYQHLVLQETIESLRLRTHCPDLTTIRVIFYCATASHAHAVARAIAEVAPAGSGSFLIASADAVHLDYSKVQFQTDAPIDVDGTTLYDYLGGLMLKPIFAQVQGRSSRGAPELGYVPLVSGPRPADREILDCR
jgi:hypothetical protein